jgi:trans-aconitate methyltransferase
MSGEDAHRDHWERVHRTQAPEAMSWHQPRPEPSLRALDLLGAGPGDSLIDVGGGAAMLVDALLDRGWGDLAVLDIARSALDAARARLGARAERVRWIAADITRWQPDRVWTVWHDRAAFHFLTEAGDRAAYRRALDAATRPGAGAILAAFAPDGLERCSGLPVRGWDAEGLAAELGPAWTPVAAWREDHRTPAGAVQAFQWAAFRRRADGPEAAGPRR